jgi:hypothetical protein
MFNAGELLTNLVAADGRNQLQSHLEMAYLDDRLDSPLNKNSGCGCGRAAAPEVCAW